MRRRREDHLGPFPPTQWSMVDRAGQESDELRRQALGQLLQRYLPALRAYLVLNRRIEPERAEDLLQGFVSDKIVEQNLVSTADRERGKFRTFLLTALSRYAIDQLRRDQAAMRSPGEPSGQVDEFPEIEDGRAGPSDQFNLAWARETLSEVLRRMREHCQRSGRMDLWAVFEGRVIQPAMEGVQPESYESLARRLELAAVLVACNLLVTAKRMFVRFLEDVAAEYAGGRDAVHEEIADLWKALGNGR